MNSGWRQQLKQLLMKSGDHMQPDIHCLRIAINCDFQQTISFPSRMNTFEHGKSSEMFHIFLYARCSLQWRNCLVIAYVYADLLSNELILSCYPSSPTDSLSPSPTMHICIYQKKPIHILPRHKLFCLHVMRSYYTSKNFLILSK